MMMRLLKPAGVWSRIVVVALVGALAFTAGSVFTAYSQPESSTIHTCVNRTTGQMRYVSNPEDCTRYELRVSWESTSTSDFDDVYVNEGQENSITSAMIVDGEVMTDDLADDSVNSDKIEDGTIIEDDLHPDLLTFIEDQSALSGWQIINSEFVELTPDTSGQNLTNQVGFDLTCPEGKTLVSGGGFSDHPLAFLVRSYPDPEEPGTWDVFYRFTATAPGATANVRAYAICVDS